MKKESLRKDRQKCTWTKAVQAASLVFTLTLVFHFTLFTRDFGAIRIFKGPFWELKNRMWHDIGLNILLFIPFGFSCAWICGWKSILIGAGVSILIESVQYIGALGYTEVDDVINNTLGAIAGYLIWCAVKYVATRIEKQIKRKHIGE